MLRERLAEVQRHFQAWGGFGGVLELLRGRDSAAPQAALQHYFGAICGAPGVDPPRLLMQQMQRGVRPRLPLFNEMLAACPAAPARACATGGG